MAPETTVVAVSSSETARAALGVIGEAERAAGVELLDESDRERVAATARGDDSAPDRRTWRAWLACRGDQPAGYASLVLPDAPSGTANAELLVAPDARRHGVGSTLLGDLERVARDEGASHLSIWARHDDTARDFALRHGYDVDRRVDVLRRPADPVPEPELASSLRLRSYRPGGDDASLIETLNLAFRHHPDRAWTPERLGARRALSWFDPEGVLVAEDDAGRVVGVHWTKDRGGGVGEVHVMGVHPDAAGQGVGRALLRAGLRHLHDRGAREVILWVEHDNVAAQALYEREGFAFAWADVAYGRDL